MIKNPLSREIGAEMSPETISYIEDAMDCVKGVPPDQPVFVFGMHKGGSTMLHNFIQIYTEMSKIRGISISDHVFRRGVSDEEYTRDERFCTLLNKRFVFYGFRYVPGFMILNKARYLNRKCVILIRDPRDCVVSAYYSFLKSHVVMSGDESDVAIKIRKEREMHNQSSIDDYAISEIGRFVDELCGFAFFAHENAAVFRYEDIIFRKREFFKKVVGELGLSWNEEAFEVALEKVDVVPHAEQVDKHIRNVRPGNYREKLQKNTIDALNARYRNVLELFGYDACA